MKSVFVVAGLITVWSVLLMADDFQGADAVLRKLAEKSAKQSEAGRPADPVGELRKKIAIYRKEAPDFRPEKAVGEWLALFDAYSVLPREALNNTGSGRDSLASDSLIEVLPPAKDWDTSLK